MDKRTTIILSIIISILVIVGTFYGILNSSIHVSQPDTSHPLPFLANSSVVGTTGYRDQWNAYQQKSFYGVGRFWVFYYDGFNNGSVGYEVYSSSVDGVTWTSTLNAMNQQITAPTQFSISFDGIYVYSVDVVTSNNYLKFVRGTPNNDGTITWQTEQTVIVCLSQENPLYPYISIDSDGYPWIAYSLYNTESQQSYPFVAKSSTNDGTWSTASGFPYQLSNVPDLYYGQAVLPLNDGKMFAFYVRGDKQSDQQYTGRAQVWNGAVWLPEIQTSAVLGGEQQGYWEWSAFSQGDSVNLAYLSNQNNNSGTIHGIGFEKYTYSTNSFTPEMMVYNSTGAWSYTQTLLVSDPLTKTAYLIWVEPSSYSATDNSWHQILFKKCVNDLWDNAPTVLVNTTLPISSPLSDSTFLNANDGYVGVIYNTNPTNSVTYNVTFTYFKIR